MTEPRTVAVMGSCITRDNFNSRFNPDYKQWYQVGATTNQSSMIALMSPPVDEPWEPLAPMKPYGAWNVRSDLNREILDLLAQDPPDLLILDFFGDVHFGVLRMHDGRFLTNNRWRIHKTDLYQRLIDDPRTEVLSWQDDEEAYFALWTDAMDRFAAFMAEQCPTTRVVVHCGFNATQVMRTGLPIPGRLRPASREARRVARLGNNFWSRINAHTRTSYGWDHIDLGNESYATTKEHPWGAFEVHYTMDYYHRFLAELHRVALRDQLTPELTARVEAIGDAAASRVAAELTYWQDLNAALAKQAETRDEDRPRGWRRLLGRRSSGNDEPSPPEDDRDRQLLAELREHTDEKIFAQVVQLADSADERVAWIRGVWEARIAHRFSPDRKRA